MIEGRVNARLEATLSLDVQRPGGRSRTIEAVVDTGYSEFLTLPSDRVGELGLTRKHQGSARLADGSEIAFDVYDAELVWDGQIRCIRGCSRDHATRGHGLVRKPRVAD